MCDDRWAGLLHSLPGSRGVEDLHWIADRLRSAPELLNDRLVGILGDEALLTTVASRSSVHPNGFTKVVPFDDSHTRLHVWRTAGPGNEAADAHGHRWDFASWVIAGTLRETTFEVDPTAASLAKWHYGRDLDGQPFLQPKGAAGLTVHSERYREAGTVYTRLGTDLHSADPVGEDQVITFVVQGPRSDKPVPVYGRPDATRDERPLSPDELTGVLTSVVDVLGSLA